MNSATLQEMLSSIELVRRFYYYAEVDSTMSQARRLVGAGNTIAHHGTLLVADYQGDGRGRHGRAWNSPPRTSVLATLILARQELPPAPGFNQLSLLAAAIPVAICQALADYLPAVRIKYPNDIVAGGRKLGGILLESTGDLILVGFGINCLQDMDNLPAQVRMPASSLYLETGFELSPATILQSLLIKISEILAPAPFLACATSMNDLCDSIGRTLSVDTGEEVLTGIARAITPEGMLLLETENGPVTLFSTQVVRTWLSDASGDGDDYGH